MTALAYGVLVLAVGWIGAMQEEAGCQRAFMFFTAWFGNALIYGLPVAAIVWAFTVIARGVLA